MVNRLIKSTTLNPDNLWATILTNASTVIIMDREIPVEIVPLRSTFHRAGITLRNYVKRNYVKEHYLHNYIFTFYRR